MKIPEIVQKGTPVLHSPADEVPIREITSTKIQQVIAEMSLALVAEPDGVAIAAPQIGINKRIFVVAGFVFGEGHSNVAYINPKIIKKSSKKELMDEGCLSVKYVYGDVERHLQVTIEAYNQEGEKIKRGAGDLLAHIFQHEIDHLDGVLFVDKAQRTKEMSSEEKEKLDQKKKERLAEIRDAKHV